MKFWAQAGKKYTYKRVIQTDIKNDRVIKIWDKLDDILEENTDYKKGAMFYALTTGVTHIYKGYKWEY